MIDESGRRRHVVWALLLGTLSLVAAAPVVRGEKAGVDGAVGCRTLSTRSLEPGEIAVDSAPFVIEKPGTYVLTRDIQAPGSCIAIAPSAAGCFLDLNGHTITYGTGRLEVDPEGKGVITYNSRQKGNVGHGAVVCPSRPDVTEDWPGVFRWNVKLEGVVVKNGKIKSGGGEGLCYSPALNLGGLDGAEIHDLIVEIDLPDSEGITTGPNTRLHHVTFIHGGRHVSNRHAQCAVVVAGRGSEVSRCKIDGGPQVGVKALTDSNVHHNEIRQRAVVTNGYGVQGYRQSNVKVHHNTIVPHNGRGVHLSEKSDGWEVHHNYIEVRETGNREYQRMETHGIKLEGTKNSNVHDNLVVAVSTESGSPTPLNVSIAPDAGNRVFGNRFVAVKTGPLPAFAAYLLGSDGQGTQFDDNTFRSNDYLVGIPWDGAVNHTFRRSTFRKIKPTDKVGLISFANAHPQGGSVGLRFVDCRFLDGVSPTSHRFPPPAVDWKRDAEYSVAWSLSLTTAPEAEVRVVDNRGVEVAKRRTDGEGRCSVDLTQFSCAFSAATADEKLTEFSPYTVNIVRGRLARRLTITAQTPMEAEVDLSGRDPVVLVPAQPGPGEVDTPYSLPLFAAAESTATWKLLDGKLPDGLRLERSAIRGTPTREGRFPFTLSATARGRKAAKAISIRIAPKPRLAPRQ